MIDTSKYEYDEHGNLLCFGFKPSFYTGKMEKTTMTVESVCTNANSHYGFADDEYVYSTRKRRDEEWDSRKREWLNDGYLEGDEGND